MRRQLTIDLPSPVELARALGGHVIGPNRVLAPGPGHSKRDRSLVILVQPGAPGGFLCKSFAGDDDLQCKDYVREKLGLNPWQDSPRIHRKRSAAKVERDDQLERVARARSIWSEAVDAGHTLVERYLRSRGLSAGPDLAGVIRFHPEHGMVAPLRDIVTDELCGLHRTYLDGEGRKVERRMLGRAKHAAIKLDSHSEVTLGLFVGEGIETCLTAQQNGFRPVWALGSAGSIAAFPVLSGLEAVTFLAEHDDSGANRRAIERCAERYLAAGLEAWIIDPPSGDLNDLVRRGT